MESDEIWDINKCTTKNGVINVKELLLGIRCIQVHQRRGHIDTYTLTNHATNGP